MAFSDTQTRQLKAKLDAQYVKTRKVDTSTLHYIEGWHAIAEANRIFGYDAWDRRTLMARCVWTGTSGPKYHAAYTARVRIRVRAGEVTVIREGSGTGEGSALTPGQAHDIALKSAETDATKRALTTFGNPFGLALYDREQAGVRQSPLKKMLASKPPSNGPWNLQSVDGSPVASFAEANAFAEALKKAMGSTKDIDALFELWEKNVSTVRDLNRSLRGDGADLAKKLVSHFKGCARAQAKPNGSEAETRNTESSAIPSATAGTNGKIDKSALTLSEPKRIRSREHLRYVASQPCVICGRVPSHAHHIRFAQSKGLALKVSDEFTVPLCAIHHSQNHTTGNELRWWQEQKIEPLAIAVRLWQEFRQLPKSS